MRKNDVFITTTHTLSLTAFRSSFDMFDSKQVILGDAKSNLTPHKLV